MGKLNNHQIKGTCATLKTKRGKWGKCGSRKNGEIEQPPKMNGDTLENNAAKNNKSAHANIWAASFYSSMSPSMSSTGWEQHGWELLGGAVERVTRSVCGTKASHCANKGNACCIARSLICRRLLPLGTFTPSTSRECDNAPLVQSRSDASAKGPSPPIACMLWATE